jgi:kynurenine formamidase
MRRRRGKMALRTMRGEMASEQQPGTRLIDLSHPIEAGMTTYPGLPVPEVSQHLTREASRSHYAPGTEFRIDVVTLCGNTGTYIDSPSHRYADGTDLAGLPIERLVDVPAVRVDAIGAGRAIHATAFDGLDLRGTAVLVHTGHDRHWRTDAYAVDSPFLARDAVGRLVEAGASIVGIDSLNIDDTGDGTRPAHTLLLGAGIPVVEHLTNLGAVPVTGAFFTALPAPFVDVVTAPVRAVARVPAGSA